MLISKHINFGCAAPKWLFSLYVNKSAVSHDQCDTKWSWWIKQEAYYVGQLVNLNWSVCFCLLFAICDAVLIKQAMVWFLKPFKRYFKKYVNSKSPLFDQPCPLYAWTRFWSYPPILSLCMGVQNCFAPFCKSWMNLVHHQPVNISIAPPKQLPPNNFAEDVLFLAPYLLESFKNLMTFFLRDDITFFGHLPPPLSFCVTNLV